MIKKNFYAAFLFIAKQKLLSEPPNQWMQTPLTYKQQLSTLTCNNFQHFHETTFNIYNTYNNTNNNFSPQRQNVTSTYEKPFIILIQLKIEKIIYFWGKFNNV